MCIRDRKVSAHTVTIVPEANDADYTISLAEAARPTLQAEVFGENGEQATYTTGKWSSSDTVSYTHLDVYKRQGQAKSAFT